MKREFKDLIRNEHYEYLNSEITGAYDEAYAVKCVNDTFVGTEEHGVASWLGIPFAKPPVGERRFKAPEYVDASDRVFEAKYYGKCAYGALGYDDCVQRVMSEDCLYLNIWVNTDDKTEKKPVMVWIHGGAYVVGSGSQSSYSGANLVQRQSDIIMLTINYRLNMYGFMDFSSVPGGENFGTAPCNGLLDQAMALRWVHENIAAFGGDPDNVTIFGQSAGGGSVSILPVMKEANRYFQKVIAQSGSTTLAFPVDCEAAQGKTKALLDYTGCKTMDDIMALSEEKLQEAYVNAVGKFTSCPYYGTEVLPEAPIELYRKGYAKHITIMAGSTADEARLFMGEGPSLTIEEQKVFAQRAVGDAVPYLKEADKKYYEEFHRVCRDQEPGLIETEFINELMFRVPMLQQLDVQSAFNKTFSYYWSYPGSNADVGAAHSVELIFVFDIRGIGTNSPFNGTTDFLTHRKKKNDGELPQYHIDNSHPAIVTKAQWDLVQVELERRSRMPDRFSPKGPLDSRLVCADCGGFFGAKTWHSSDPYKTVIWRCNDKYRPGIERKSGGEKCCTGHVTGKKVMEAFGEIVAGLIARKPQVIETCETILRELLNGGALDDKRKRIEQECDAIAKEIEALVEQQARGTVEGFTEKYQELEKRYHRVEDKLTAVAAEKQDRSYRAKQAELFLETMKGLTEGADLESTELFMALVDKVVVGDGLTFVLRDGTEQKVGGVR